MKKTLLISVLIAFLALGTAFAEVTGVGSPSVSGDVTLTAGFDLDNEGSGFANDANVTVKLPLVTGSATKGGDDMYGEITISDIGYYVSNDPAGFYDADEDGSTLDASVSAKLVLGSAWIGLGNPDFTFNNVDLARESSLEAAGDSDDDNIDVNCTVAGTAGMSVGFANDMVSLSALVASENNYKGPSDDVADAANTTESWTDTYTQDADSASYTANSDHNYIFGATLSLTPMDGVSLPVNFAYNMANSDAGVDVIAVGTAPSVSMSGVTLDVPVDYIMNGDASGLETKPAVSYALTDGGSKISAAFLFTQYTDIAAATDDQEMEPSLTFTEVESGGFVEGFAHTTSVGLGDLSEDTVAWTVDMDNSYNANGIKPYVNFGYGQDEVFDLQVGMNLLAAATTLDNTTVTLDYTNEDLTTDASEKGRITASVKVAY